MQILDLSLTHHWYDEIHAGRKPEEYRELKWFYWRRLFDPDDKELYNSLEEVNKFRHYDAIRFHRGQGSPMTMLIECKGISIGYGNPEWGAPIDRKVFRIRLGRILSESSGGADSLHE